MRDPRRLLILLLLGAAPPVASGAAGVEDLLVDVHGAVWHAEKRDTARSLTLRLERENGQSRPRVVGHARRYNQADHTGAVAEARSGGAQLRLSVLMRINPAPWLGGATIRRCERRPELHGGRRPSSASRRREPAIRGKGLDTKVTLGRQTIAFDGQRVRLSR